jgi:hypothetical protein
MPVILRVDVDKPYGNATFYEKVLSKMRENYWFPALPFLGYLKQLKKFLQFLKEEKIRAHIYFRKCTLPHFNQLHNHSLDEHEIGVHIENTKNYNTFKKEIEEISKFFFPIPINSFTKHGSGSLKLGKNHFAPYEPEKYMKWATYSGTLFLFGNDEYNSKLSCSYKRNKHYPKVFWIDRLSDNNRYQLYNILDLAKRKNVVVIIHPERFVADSTVENDLRKFVSLTKKYHVEWITI